MKNKNGKPNVLKNEEIKTHRGSRLCIEKNRIHHLYQIKTYTNNILLSKLSYQYLIYNSNPKQMT